MLSCVESRIRLSDQSIQIRGFHSLKRCGSKTRGCRDHASSKCKLLVLKLFANLLNSNCDALLVFYVAENQEKFFASQTGAHVRPPGIAVENFRKTLNHDIAGSVSMGVIDHFETIQVSHDDPNRKTMPDSCAQFAARPDINRTPVGQAREVVRQCHSLQ